ncbi:MAG: C25 family cysteine peptidase, partial [Ignavibacteria bacterium]
MKRLIFITLIFGFNFCVAQNYNWITPGKDYLKLYVSDDGVYRINKIDFVNSGVNTVSIDPRTVKVFYMGSQIPVFFYGEDDGVFNDSDYFDFYGQRNYGGITNTYKESGYTTVPDYTTDEYFNLYSDTSAYWIGWDGANGLRFSNYTYSTNIDFPQNYFLNKIHFEKDLIYSLGETVNPETDFRYFNTEKVSGEGWFWKEMQLLNTITDTFSTPYLSLTPQTCSLKIFAYPNNNNPGHRLIIKINSTTLDTLKRAYYNKFDTTIFFPSSLLSNVSVNQITIKYTTQNLSGGYLYFDCFSVFYPRSFIFVDNRSSFKTGLSDTASKKFSIKGFQNNETNIYDIKNGYKILNNTTSSDTLFFTGKGNGNFEVVNKYITKKPFRIKKRQVPNLLSTTNGADYLVVYNNLFESQAEQLRAYRGSHDNFRSVKAEVEDIYDIFNFGMENPVAIRNFVKYAYTNWQSPGLKFICLFGRGSLDPKKNFSSSVYYQNFVPVYGNPPSDGYFANMNFGSFVYYPQISVGRLPVYTTQEAQDVVNKIINYENNPLDVWVKKFNFITGGFNGIQQTQFITSANGLINSYISLPPVTGYPVRIYRTDTSGQVSYSYEDSIKNVINRGNLIVNYIGHAATTTWDNGIRDPNVLSNGTKTPLVLSMTCFTGKNAHTDADRGFGEKFVYIPNKGAIGFIGTTGWSFFPGGGNTLDDLIFKSFSRDSLRRIGDILKSAETYLKNSDTTSFANKNTINSYNLLGDPASKLLIPSYPEFDIQMSDFQMKPVFPSLQEQITLSLYPKNLGTRA